jgi:hypothetical protein
MPNFWQTPGRATQYTSPPTNGRRDLQPSNALDHDALWAQNKQKLYFLKH